jgi:hypothetical protein
MLTSAPQFISRHVQNGGDSLVLFCHAFCHSANPATASLDRVVVAREEARLKRHRTPEPALTNRATALHHVCDCCQRGVHLHAWVASGPQRRSTSHSLNLRGRWAGDAR